MADDQLRNQIISQLFDGVDPDSEQAKTGEKLVFFARVGDETRKLFKPAFQNRNNDDDDDDDDGKGKQKNRIVIVSIKKGQKVKLMKVKQERFGSLTTKNTWGLDEVKSIEKAEDGFLVLNVGKTQRWSFESPKVETDFLSLILDLCKSHLKRAPKLININSAESAGKDKTRAVTKKRANKEGDKADSLDMFEFDDFLPEDDEMELAASYLPDIDLNLVLSDFDWQASGDASALEARLITELQALEAANVHDIIQSESRANAVVEEISATLDELAEIEKWLNQYTRVLESMGQDVHQIEAQNKAMQIASSNQKVLLKEVEKLLGSLRLPGYAVEVLKNEPLDMPEGVKECENALTKLMDILRGKYGEMTEMQAIKERLSLLQGYANNFSFRLSDYLAKFFEHQAEYYLQDKNRASQRGSLKLYGHEGSEAKLFKFRKLLTWLKEVDPRLHSELQRKYTDQMSRAYRKEIGEYTDILKVQHMSRKVAIEDLEYVFSTQANTVSTAATNVIKSAIKAGNMGADKSDKSIMKQKLDALRGKRRGSVTKDDGDEEGRGMVHSASNASMDANDEKMPPDEALGHALLKLVHIIVREQNFVSDFFGLGVSGTHKEGSMHDTTVVAQSIASISDSLSGDISLQDWQEALGRPRHLIRDTKAQKRLQEIVDNMFEDVRDMLSILLDAGLRYDQTYAVGMLVHVEFYLKEYTGTSHIFLINSLESLQRKASQVFEKFVVEQIKAIEDTKVTSKKRTGILPFFRTFPRFVDRMEQALSNWDGTTRKTVDRAYAKIIKAMFETLEAVAQQASNDNTKANADDKGFLNIQIMTIENMHHFYAEVRARKVPALDAYVKQAKVLYDANLEAYCNVVIRKPLGKLMEFFEGVEGLLKTGPAEEVSFHIQFSKNALKDVIRKYPGKEIKKGLEALYKRVDKHFTEEEGLLQVVWRGIQEEFTRQLRRYEELMAKCYPEISIRLDFTMDELLGYFSELAMAH